MKKLIVVGAGGHAKVLIDAILSNHDYEVIGATDINNELWGKEIYKGIRILGDDSILDEHSPNECEVVIGVGISLSLNYRKELYEKIKNKLFKIPAIKHKFTYIGKQVEIMEGVQILSGAVINSGSQIRENTIVNTGVIIEHDCRIGAHTLIGPGAILGGNVEIGNGCFIGMGAKILPNVFIGKNVIVGAGSVVLKDIPDFKKVVGVPAKIID